MAIAKHVILSAAEESPVCSAVLNAKYALITFARGLRQGAGVRDWDAAWICGAVSSTSTVSDGNPLRRRELSQRRDDLRFYNLVVSIAQIEVPRHVVSVFEHKFDLHQQNVNLCDRCPGDFSRSLDKLRSIFRFASSNVMTYLFSRGVRPANSRNNKPNAICTTPKIPSPVLILKKRPAISITPERIQPTINRRDKGTERSKVRSCIGKIPLTMYKG